MTPLKFKLTIGLFLLSGAAFGQTQVPNDFQAGTPARASEVNENFATVATAIDENANSIVSTSATVAMNSADIADNASAIMGLISGSGIQVFSQGIPIGRFVGTAFTQGSRQSVTSSSLWVISDQGFIFAIDGDIGEYLAEIGTIYFSQPACAGDAFVGAPTLAWTAASGAVFRAPSGFATEVYYTARGESRADRTTQSFYESQSGCVSGNTTVSVYRAFPNDPSVTGVPNVAPTRPLTVGIQ